jgi:hypothetical protein
MSRTPRHMQKGAAKQNLDRGGIEVRHRTLEDVGDLGGVDCSPMKRRGRRVGDGRDGAQGKQGVQQPLSQPQAQGKETEETTVVFERARMGLRVAMAASTGQGWGFDRGLRLAASSGDGGFDRGLRPGALSGGGSFDRRRLGLAREEEVRGGKCGGEEIDRCGPNRYLAKCHLCVVHYARYAPRIFDT